MAEWSKTETTRSRVDGAGGYLHPRRYVLHDRETRFCASFRSVLAAGGVRAIPLPARSPNLNAFAERWVRAAKQECLSRLILFGERPLSRALPEFSAHYHGERNHLLLSIASPKCRAFASIYPGKRIKEPVAAKAAQEAVVAF